MKVFKLKVKEEYGRIRDDINKMKSLEKELEKVYVNALETKPAKKKKTMKAAPVKKHEMWEKVLKFWQDHKTEPNPMYRSM